MIDQTTQEEKQYRFELTEFKLKNPSADEKYFINHRIDILEDVLKDYKHTADFEKGEMLDGKEFINGVWTVTKTGTVSDHLYFSKELDFLKDKLIELSKPKQIKATSKKKDYKEENWFVVGLLFATGEMQEALKKHNGNATEVAKLLKNEKGYRPFISDSMSNSTLRVTNIFSRPDKLTKIYLYCIENKIVMCDEFLSKYDQIEPE
ncbi:hypothetical protein EKL32_26920 [Flavobacterium sp. GSN2]|nr:hypothetical protein EKL32_26920 [Flavobacterium sp. GSN2]